MRNEEHGGLEAELRRVIETDERKKDYIAMTTHINSLALLCEADARYDDAVALYKRGLNICKSNRFPVGTLAHNLSLLLFEQLSRYEEAEPYFKMAIEYYEDQDSSNPNIPQYMSCLIEIYESQGRAREVEGMMLQMKRRGFL
jgi:tetratricopeptide (TPR) repeat protein